MSADKLADVADIAVARQAKRREEERERQEHTSHHDLAVAWCDRRSLDGHSPVYANGVFHAPSEDGLWRRLSAEQVQAEIARTFNGHKLCRKRPDYVGICAHASALCEDESYFDDRPLGVVTPEGLHRLSDVGQIEVMPLALDHRQTFRLAWSPEFEAECPLLDGVLQDAFAGDDAGAQTALWWEAVGATIFGLMPRLQQVLLLLGRERSGKSLLQRVLERLFPASEVSAVSPASWGHEYHGAALAGKAINIVGELDDQSTIPAAAFKNVTGLNLVSARHPTHRPFSFRCTAAHWFASNVLPPTTDRSEAFYRRWRVLRFRNTVPIERVDPLLFEKIVAGEMPAILASAFLGAERVARAGRLSATSAHDDAMKSWRLAANPLQQFLTDDEWVELDPSAEAKLPTTEVYQAYRRWAAAAGFRNPFGRNHFLELLDSTGATRGVTVARSVVGGMRLLPRGGIE